MICKECGNDIVYFSPSHVCANCMHIRYANEALEETEVKEEEVNDTVH
jgi:uncharacterized OB-fold protein